MRFKLGVVSKKYLKNFKKRAIENIHSSVPISEWDYSNCELHLFIYIFLSSNNKQWFAIYFSFLYLAVSKWGIFGYGYSGNAEV